MARTTSPSGPPDRGYSTPATFAFLFLATLVATSAFYGATHDAAERGIGAGNDRLDAHREQLDTDIEIAVAKWNGETLIVEVENTGSVTLDVTATDLVANGTYRPPDSFDERTVDGADSEYWAPGEVLRIEVATGAVERVKVVVEHGIASFTGVRHVLGDALVFTSSDELRSMERNESITGYDVLDAPAIGPLGIDFDDDGRDEVPFVDSLGTVTLIDANNESEDLLSEAAKSSETRLAVGTWQGSDQSVFYVDAVTGDIERVTANGSTTTIADVSGDGVAGIADFDGDGEDELVYGGDSGTSDSVNYVDDNGTTVTTDAGYGVNNGIGLGEPGDFDGDGTARVPIVDGSNNILLVDSDGNTETINGSGVATKAPLATLDWDGDGDLEIVFVHTDGTLRYVDDVTGSNTVKTVEDADGNSVSADGDAGAA